MFEGPLQASMALAVPRRALRSHGVRHVQCGVDRGDFRSMLVPVPLFVPLCLLCFAPCACVLRNVILPEQMKCRTHIYPTQQFLKSAFSLVHVSTHRLTMCHATHMLQTRPSSSVLTLEGTAHWRTREFSSPESGSFGMNVPIHWSLFVV